jgi:hypothetical protein
MGLQIWIKLRNLHAGEHKGNLIDWGQNAPQRGNPDLSSRNTYRGFL